MAATPGGITMEVLLNGLLEKTNAVRKQAEEYYLSQVTSSEAAMASVSFGAGR
jgi:hypothetical protein